MKKDSVMKQGCVMKSIKIGVGNHSAHAEISIPACRVVIHMYIGLLVGIIMIKQEEEQGAEGPKEVLWGEA